MQIVFLNNFYYLRGGSERVFFEEMRIFREAGHRIAGFSRASSRNESSEYERFFPPDMVTDTLRISLTSLKVVKELFYSKSSKAGLKRVIDDFRPDVAHAHNIYGRLSLSVLDTLRNRGIPTVLTLHDYKLLCPSYLMLNHGNLCERCKRGNFFHALTTRCHKNSYAASAVYALESWFNLTFAKYDSISYFISPSQFLRNKVIEFGIPPERVAYVPNFIDHQTITPALEPGRYFLFLGRLTHEKGVSTLLDAFASLPRKARLMIVGDGPLRNYLESLASNAGVRVRFTGYLNGKLLKDAIAGAKAIVIPSEWYENAPLSLLEAFSYGKPVIASRIGGIPEMVDDGINGFLFEAKNREDLQNKLDLVMNLPGAEIRRMGREAREKVEREFSPQMHYVRLVSVYQQAIG